MSPVTTYTPRRRETKWSKVPCLRKQRDGRGLNPGLPDPELEVLTARPHMPPPLPDNNYPYRDPVSLAGPVNTRGLRNFAPKFELGIIRDYAGVREKSTWLQSQSDVKYTPLSGVKGHSHTLFKSQGGGT